MKSSIAKSKFVPQMSTINLVLLSAAMVTLVFLLQGNAGFNIPDEGFLWYGTIRTALGDVPTRDFTSYDPGRYYWGAMWFKLLRNDGILALRIGQAAFEFIGLTIALLLMRRLQQRWLPLLGAGLLLMIWMFPPWKIYEPVIIIAAVYFAVLIIEKPSKGRHLIAGAFIGLAAFFGRNHGLYCSLAFVLLIFFVWWKNDRRELLPRLGALFLGIIIGYSPMLFLFAIHGFFASFKDAILFNIYYGTNLPLPVPWPWRIQNYSHTWKEEINKIAIGVAYMAVPAFYSLVGLGLLLKSKLRANSVLIACTFVGAAYLQYTFDRAHLYYLAWTIPPFILGLIALTCSFPDRYRKVLTWTVWSFLLIISLTAADMAPENYFLLKAKSAVRATLLSRLHMNVGLDMPAEHFALVKTDVRGDQLWVTRDVAELIDAAKRINNQIGPGNDSILIAPYWTGLYPILRKQSPTWEIYFLFPQPKTNQQRITGDLEGKHVNWALVCNHYIDGRPELAFQKTHNYVWQYLTANFEPVPIDRPTEALRDCQLLQRTNSTGASPRSDPSPLPTPAVRSSTAVSSPQP